MTEVYRKDLSYHQELANLGKTRFINIASYRVKLGHTEDLMAGSKMLLALACFSSSNRWNPSRPSMKGRPGIEP